MSHQRYYAFGDIRPDLGGTNNQTDFGYTGQRNMSSLGLMDYKARFYDPILERFLQPDNIIPDESNSQTWNRYAYVMNNPIRFNDPTGHNACDSIPSGPSRDACNNSGYGEQEKADDIHEQLEQDYKDGKECAGFTNLQKDLCDPHGYKRTKSDQQILTEAVIVIGVVYSPIIIVAAAELVATAATAAAARCAADPNCPKQVATTVYEEYKALRLQGFTASEAFDLAKQFNKGVNPGNQFGFHFTTPGSAAKIVSSGELFASKSGLAGPGVYMGKLPMPGILRVIPVIGYGLEPSRSTRIPIFLSNTIQAGLRSSGMPNTLLYGNGQSLFLNP